MQLRIKLPVPRFSLRGLLLFTAAIGVAVWRTQAFIDFYRRQEIQIVKLREQGTHLNTEPIRGGWLWSRLPGLNGTRFQTVTGVATRFTGPDADNQTLQLLDGMTEITEVWLQSSRITDEGTAFLGKLTKLEELYLRCPNVSDASIRRIDACRTLQVVCFEGPQFGNESVRIVSALPHLKSLEIRGGKVDEHGLKHLKNMPSLESLRLKGDFPESALDVILGCQNLKSLHLIVPAMTDKTLRAVSALPELGELRVRYGFYTDKAMAEALTRIQRTNLMPTLVVGSHESLDRFGYSVVTKQLDQPDPQRFYDHGGIVEGIHLVIGADWTGKDPDLLDAAAFPDVTDVTVKSPRVHVGGIAALSEVVKLESLSIMEASITLDVVPYLCRMKMRSLSLAGAHINDSWVPELAQLTNLKQLELVDTSISREGAEKLQQAGVVVQMRSTKPIVRGGEDAEIAR